MPSNLRYSTRNHNILVKTPVMSQLALNYLLEYKITMTVLCKLLCWYNFNIHCFKGCKMAPGKLLIWSQNFGISCDMSHFSVFFPLLKFKWFRSHSQIYQGPPSLRFYHSLSLFNKTFQFQVQNINSFYWQLYSSFNISSENLVVDQKSST